MTDEDKAIQIAALISERRGYLDRGLEDRVKMVDEQLRALGHEAAPPAARATRRPAPRTRAKETR